MRNVRKTIAAQAGITVSLVLLLTSTQAQHMGSRQRMHQGSMQQMGQQQMSMDQMMQHMNDMLVRTHDMIQATHGQETMGRTHGSETMMMSQSLDDVANDMQNLMDHMRGMMSDKNLMNDPSTKKHMEEMHENMNSMMHDLDGLIDNVEEIQSMEKR